MIKLFAKMSYGKIAILDEFDVVKVKKTDNCVANVTEAKGQKTKARD
jgi:hypothetical protein